MHAHRIKDLSNHAYKLGELMMEYNIGVSKVTSYEIKKKDLDYFSED